MSSCRPQVWNVIKKETATQVFSCGLWEIFKSIYLVEKLRWVLLIVKQILTYCLTITTVKTYNINNAKNIFIMYITSSELKIRNCNINNNFQQKPWFYISFSILTMFIEEIYLKGYFRCKTITFQSVSSEAQVKSFFYLVEKLCFVLKIFKFLYF